MARSDQATRPPNAHLEIWDAKGARLVPLRGDAFSVGSLPANDLCLDDDPAVSRLHCVLVRYAPGWTVRDLNSLNGTYVNGRRLWGETPLEPGDEITLGSTRVRYSSEAVTAPGPLPLEPLPYLTRRERDALIALCRPLVGGDAFANPASVRQIAEALLISEAAVRQHLLRLAAKLAVEGDGERRRTAIANEALRRGLVTVADLQTGKRGD